MKRDYPNKDVDLCLIATSEVDMGARSLSSFMKEKGYRVAVGFFDSWGMYKENELGSIIEWIRETNPRVIGISTIEFAREKALQLAAAVKQSGKTIVAGGIDATFCPECYLDHADFVVRGEGEYSLAALVDAVIHEKDPRGIPNVCYRGRDGAVVINRQRPLIQDLDEIPYDDWLDLDHHFELQGGRVRPKRTFAILDIDNHTVRYGKNIRLFTIRGCAGRCSYCMNSKIRSLNPGEKHIRKRSVASVIRRVGQLLTEEPSIEMVYFSEDDFFLRTLDEIREFSREWKLKFALPFNANCTPFMLEEEKLRELLDAGLVSISMGIQTGSERTNFEIYERQASNELALSAARMLGKYKGRGRFGFASPRYDLIINNPYETEDDLLRTIDLLRQLPKPYYLNVSGLQFLQGTRLHEKAMSDGIVAGRDEVTKYNFHDVIRHFDVLIKRGGNYYLNSLLYWMEGNHVDGQYGIIAPLLLKVLTRKEVISYCNRHPRLVAVLNSVLPTQKRVFNAKMRYKAHFIKYMDRLFSAKHDTRRRLEHC